jgi:mannose-1-phosphate guanylyltransferase
MKAILLAAGRGTRLRPLTHHTPKCLVPINGRPLLDYWLETCVAGGVTEVLVNAHHLADEMRAYLSFAEGHFALRIHFTYEPSLRGTGGTVLDNLAFVEGEDTFLLAHADNFTDLDLVRFREFHRQRAARLSLALFRTDAPESCGIVEELDDDGRIVRFTEKPAAPRSNLASAAVFLLSPDIVRGFPPGRPIDFSREVLPAYQGRMYGFEIDGYNVDVGTPEGYYEACKLALRSPRAPEITRAGSSGIR